MPDPNPSTRLIRFRCSRCMQNLNAPEERSGKKIRCPYCYFDLVVPRESTRQNVKESDLYAVDEKPVDTRDLAHRNRFASFSCPTCMAILAVESESQLGTQIVCPDCGASVTVPLQLKESFSEKERKAAEIQDRNSGLAYLHDTSGLTLEASSEIYGLSGSSDAPSFSDGRPLRNDDGSFAVYCGLCQTMMYATDDMIGQKLTCPDCGSETLVRKPEKAEQELFQTTSFEGGTYYGSQSAPEIFELGKHFSNVRLVPVVCTLCETRMYAPETEIGGWKTCPDCGTKTVVKDVPEEQRILPQSTGSEYGVKETPAAQRPTFRVGVDYRTVEGSLDLEHQRKLQKIKAMEEAQKEARKNPKGKTPVAVPPKKKVNDGKNEKTEEKPIELIVQKPFSPQAIPGAQPDSYDLVPTAPRLIPKPPPLPEMLDAEEPVAVPVGVRPELLVGKVKPDADDSDRPAAVENVRMKNRRSLSKTKTAAVTYHRTKPPRFPLTNRLFQPFFCHDFRQLLITTISIGTLPAAALTYAGPEGFNLFKGGIVGAGGESAFWFLILTTCGVVTGSFWISFFVTYLLHFFAGTSDGDDELGLQPEYSYTDGLFLAGRMVLLSAFAALPGYLIWMIAHLFVLDWQGAELTFDNVFRPISDPILRADGEMGPGKISFFFVTMCLFSHWFFYPLLFLSSNETEEGGLPYDSQTTKSLFTHPSLWSGFYACTLPIMAFLACYVYSYFINGIFLESLFWSGLFFVSFLILGSIALVLYFRILGRLAWVIESESRKENEEEEN